MSNQGRKSKTHRSILMRVSRGMLWIAAGLLTAVILVAAATQTQWFRDYLRDRIVSATSENLNATLTIGRISGNLYSTVTLHDVLLVQPADTLAVLPVVALEYDLWPLLKDNIIIESVDLHSPHISLAMLSDSSWNVSSILPTEPEPSTGASTSDFGYAIDLGSLTIRDGRLSIAMTDSLSPYIVDSIGVHLGGFYSRHKQTATLHDLRLMIEDPFIRLNTMQARVSLLDSTAYIDRLKVSTRENHMELSGEYSFREQSSGHITLTANDINLSEFDSLIGFDLPQSRPSLTIQAELNHDSLSADVSIHDGDHSLKVSGWITPLLAGLSDSSRPGPAYAIDARVNLPQVEQWIADTLASGMLSGAVAVVGVGFEPDDAAVNADLQLSNATIMRYPVREAAIRGQYEGDSAFVDIAANGRDGSITVAGALTEISTHLKYNLQFTAKNLNVQPFMSGDTKSTSIVMEGKLSGQGYKPDSASGRAMLSAGRSRMGDILVDSLSAQFGFDPDQIVFDTFYVSGTPGSLSGGGTIGLDRSGELTLTGDIVNIGWLSPMLGIDSLRAIGRVTATVRGRIDSLGATGSLVLADILYDEFMADSLAGSFDLVWADSALTGGYDFRTANLFASDMVIPSVHVVGQIDSDSYSADLQATIRDDLSGSLSAVYHDDSIPSVDLSDIDLQIGPSRWSSGSDVSRLTLFRDGYELTELRLSGQAHPDVEQQETSVISLAGWYGVDSTHSGTISARNVDLELLTSFSTSEQYVSGLINLDARFTGRVDNPTVQGWSTLRNSQINDYDFDSLAGEFSLTDSIATVDFTLHVQGPESLAVAGTVPLAMISDTIGLGPDSGLDVRIRSYGFTLSILQAAGYSVENAMGDLSIDLRAQKSLNDPRVDGLIEIERGSIRAPDYGVDYRDVTAHIRFDSTSATLEELVAKRDKGQLRVTGRAEFTGGLLSGMMDAADLTLTAKDFYLVRHRHYELQISADVNLGGEVTSPQFGGDITVQRSSFYLPAFTEEESESSSLTTPMLVAALVDTSAVVDTVGIADPSRSDTTTSLPSEFMSAMRGRLKVQFPRNTWIRDKDMKLEIQGELDVVKEGDEFELFGTIDVVRGDYALYGKRFKIADGSMVFEGGAAINPRLDISAVYVFRTPNREKRHLTLSIGGRAENPTVSFKIDDVQIEEGDAVSYIVFGRSIGDLTSGQRSAISGEGTSNKELARGAIANLLAGKLTETLGKEFSLDVIEINAHSDWQSASFVVGKYLTTDLFVSYQRGVGTTHDDDDIVPEIVTLEYEISRNLFFQLVAADARKSGFDLILKFDWE